MNFSASMGNTLEQAWQWLVPPVVADSDGKLLPRSRVRAVQPAGQPKGAAPFQNPQAPSSALNVPLSGQALQGDFFDQTPASPRCSHEAQADREGAAQLFEEAQELAVTPEPLEAAGFLGTSLRQAPGEAKPEPVAARPPGHESNLPAASSTVLQPDLLVHPGANQQMRLQGRDVHYLLRRSGRRSIGFTVGLQGLVVTAPQWVSLKETQAALASKAGWIVEKLQELQHRRAQSEAARTQWGDGGFVDFLGQSMRLQLLADSPAAMSRPASQQIDSDGRYVLSLSLPPSTAATQVRATVKAWMLREARTHFVARLQHFAPIVGVHWQALRLTSARTRWGSANTQGLIRLNWRLMQHDPAVIDYVVVHELAHLHHMDHSPQFWAVVGSVLPDWKKQRLILKDRPLAPWE